jgi:hypothetical protein
VSTIDETSIPPLRLVDATAFAFTESYSICRQFCNSRRRREQPQGSGQGA